MRFAGVEVANLTREGKGVEGEKRSGERKR